MDTPAGRALHRRHECKKTSNLWASRPASRGFATASGLI